MGQKIATVIFLAAFVFGFAWSAPAMGNETPAEFYKGKNITLLIPVGPGGGYDTMARVTAPYLKKLTGAANVIVQNMAGAGGMRGMNYVYNMAKPDGLTLSIFAANAMLIGQLVNEKGRQYEVDKFSYIGNFYQDPGCIVLGANLPYKTPKDLAALKMFRMGTNRAATSMTFKMAIFANALGLNNMKIVQGYSGTNEIVLAIARGELTGGGSDLSTYKRFAAKGYIKLFCLLAKKRDKRVPDLPTIYQLAKSSGRPVGEEEAKWIQMDYKWQGLNRALFAPPNIPKDRLKYLRGIFTKLTKDKKWQKAFLAAGFPVDNPSSGSKAQETAGSVRMSKKNLAAFRFLILKKYF